MQQQKKHNSSHAYSSASGMPPLPCGLMKLQWTKPDFSFPFNMQIYTIVYLNFVSIHISKVAVNKIINSSNNNNNNNNNTEMAREWDWMEKIGISQKTKKHFNQKIEQSFMFPYSKCCFPLHSVEIFFRSFLSIVCDCIVVVVVYFFFVQFPMFTLGIFCCCEPNQVGSSLINIILCNISNVLLHPSLSRFHYPMQFALIWIFT